MIGLKYIQRLSNAIIAFFLGIAGKTPTDPGKVHYINIKKGLTLYELNLATCAVKRVKVDPIEQPEGGQVVMQHNGAPHAYTYRQDHMYCQALNNKTAVKKFKKDFKDMYSTAVQQGVLKTNPGDMNRTINMLHYAKD